MAAPHVSGAAALVWTLHPTWDNDRVRRQLETTAKRLPGQQLGAGRLDLFDAVFDGSFEGEIYESCEMINGGTFDLYSYYFSNVLCKPNTWRFFGSEMDPGACPSADFWYPGANVTTFYQLGPITRCSDKGYMWYMVTDGPLPYHAWTVLEQDFVIQPGVTSLSISFDYNYLTEDCVYNDIFSGFTCPRFHSFNIIVDLPGVTSGFVEGEIVYNQTPELKVDPVYGICLSTPCKPVRMTDWQSITIDRSTFPELSNVTPGPAKIHIWVGSEVDGPFCPISNTYGLGGGNLYKSAVLIDNVQLRSK